MTAIHPIRNQSLTETSPDTFYEIINVTGLEEEFLELRLRNGKYQCFLISRIAHFGYDPQQGCIEFRHEDKLVTIKGRGLFPALFRGIKKRRVAWIREADSEMQDHAGNTVYVESIEIRLYRDHEKVETD